MPTIIEPLNPGDIYDRQSCTSMEHNPPSHIVIPDGHRMVHTCPRCGHRTIVYPANIIYLTEERPRTIPQWPAPDFHYPIVTCQDGNPRSHPNCEHTKPWSMSSL